ncbi:MAG: NADH-dependent dehydrogenase [Isosphaeraceae bacterium]|jgi:predicted dehydrogenase|nr:MAG: NADH-dependent dehydrogenase [Isosphaeraceae bacterium]
MRPRPTSRRTFLAASTALALAGRSGRADDPPASPNDSITLGFIGVGGMGTGLLNIFKGFGDVRVAAVCDVDERHARRAREEAGGQAEIVKDFRRVLDRRDIDAVVVATPDHWHAIPTILACQAGKDVYCEKPLTYSIEEGRRVAAAAAKHQRVTQMGNLIHASETYHRIAEIVQSGVLGTIRLARVWMARRDGGIGNPPDSTPPAGVDYAMWLGPAPERPFNANRFHFNWRYFWDYAGGQLADFVCHLVDPVLWGMKTEAPVSVVAHGQRFAQDNGETPDSLEVVYHFAEGFDLVWSHQNHNDTGFFGRPAGVAFYGTRGTLHGHYNDYKIEWARGEEGQEPEPTLPRSPGHHREWLDAIKTRAQCSCNFAYGHRLSSIGHLGNIAFKTGRRLAWDPTSERFPDDDHANALLHRSIDRSPWTLPET